MIQKKHTTFVFFVYTERKNDVYIAKNENIFDVLNKSEIFLSLIQWKRHDPDKCVDCCRNFRFRVSSFFEFRNNIDKDNYENKINKFWNVVVFIKFECKLFFDFVSNAFSEFVSLIILNYRFRLQFSIFVVDVIEFFAVIAVFNCFNYYDGFVRIKTHCFVSFFIVNSSTDVFNFSVFSWSRFR